MGVQLQLPWDSNNMTRDVINLATKMPWQSHKPCVYDNITLLLP